MSSDVAVKLCHFSLFILLSSALAPQLRAEDENIIVITADRIKSENIKTSSDVRIFSEKEIRASNARTLPELLSQESDLVVTSSGQTNSNTSLFLRGTDSSHTLVVIDGIVMNDPGNPNRQFDFGKLSLNNLEKIEVLKGSQGLAYGSNAIGGVIVITTKKAKSDELHGEHYYNAGSFNTYSAGVNFQKKFAKLSSSLGVDLFKTEGFSAANEKTNTGAEKDGSKRATLDFNSTYNLSEEYDTSLIARYSRTDADIDKGGGPGQDDPNDELTEEELYSRIQLRKLWDGGNAESKMGFNHSSHRRVFEVHYDRIHTQNLTSISKGQLNEINFEHTYYPGKNLIQNINMSFQREADQDAHYNENLSGLIYHQLDLAKIIFNFGLRIDHNKMFNEHLTYKAAAGYKTETGLIKFSFSTGFRAPSINQLFASVYGNPNLVPETSHSSDLSYDVSWNENLKTSSTLFYTKIKDRFSYIPVTLVNTNNGSAEILGLEQKLAKNWSLSLGHTLNHALAFTLLKTKDFRNGEKLARRPDINIRNNLDYQIKDHHFINCEFAFTGQRNDVDNNGNTVKSNAYFLTNTTYKYKANESAEIYLQIKNLFDKNYEETYGFGTGGRSFMTGARYFF